VLEARPRLTATPGQAPPPVGHHRATRPHTLPEAVEGRQQGGAEAPYTRIIPPRALLTGGLGKAKI